MNEFLTNSMKHGHLADPKEQKRRFLSWINSEIPVGVDWKDGARTYCKNMIADYGDQYRSWQLVKPFVDCRDFSPFFHNLYTFLNVIETVALPKQASVLDVACGGGWGAPFFGKLGGYGVGI